MKIFLATSTAAMLVLAAGISLAGTDPNYDCPAQNARCVKACDEGADTGKNAKAYQRCLDNCERADKSCTDRQDLADHCAPAFKQCIANAHSQSAKESCRKAYRSCKGTP